MTQEFGTQSSFGNASIEQGPKLAAKTSEAIHKLQIFTFAVKNIPVFLKHKGWRLKLGPKWEINSNLILRIAIKIYMLTGCKLRFVPHLVQKCCLMPPLPPPWSFAQSVSIQTL